MDGIIADLEAQQAELNGLIDQLDEDGWKRASRCEGWTVADVVLHVAQTNEMAIASAEGRFAEAMAALTDGLDPAGSIDEGADRMVARERGGSTAAVLERWLKSSVRLVEAVRACDPRTRVTWVAGELSVQTLATTRLAETWIHTGDVAAAFGREPMPTDRLHHIARLAWRTLPYAFGRAGRRLTGPVAFRLRGPAGDAWDFVPDDEPMTTIRGDAAELCLVAARRVDPADTGLQTDGPDGAGVLELVRTWA